MASSHLEPQAASPPVGVPTPSNQDVTALSTTILNQKDAAVKISEAVPQEPDGFDWQEDFTELTDGMAALSVEPKGTGYLGEFVNVSPHLF